MPNRLADFVEGMPAPDAAIVLQKFYEAAYKHCRYWPANGDDKWRLLIGSVGPYLPKGAKVLDVGCGPGQSVKAMIADGYDGYGADFANIEHVWKAEGLAGRCVTADAAHLPFSDGIFDLVMCNDMMEHIREDSVLAVLKELVRVGKWMTAISVCLMEELSPVGGVVLTHITLKPSEWWKEKYREVGLDGFAENESEQRLNIVHFR